MARILKTTFQLRRGTAADWGRVNPVLEAGEPGYALDTNDLRIGNGVDHWNDLPSASSQKSIKAYGTHLEFPSVGNVNHIYQAVDEHLIYQWNPTKMIYEPMCGAFDDYDEINGGNANGNS